ncbi:porin family protein [Mariprofundus ferrinatatus]|nr:porin family protein [Mariprofundus ferrinatatus]
MAVRILLILAIIIPFAAMAEQSDSLSQQQGTIVTSSAQSTATPEELAQVATQLLVEGRVDLASIVVNELLKLPHPPMQALFIAAKLAELRGDWNSAIKFYRAMLERDPAVLRVRLDLARALFMVGDTEASQHHFQRVLGEPGLPEGVRKNVLLFINQIERLTFSQILSFEILGDSNVNQATASEAVIIGGRRFVLSPTARQQSGKGIGVNWQGQYRFGESRQFSLRGVLEHQNHPSANQYNLTYLMGLAGWTMQWSPGHSTSFEAGWHGAFYGGRNLFDGAAFRISDLYRTISGWTLNPAIESKQLRYPNYPLRDGWQHWLTLDISRATASGVMWNTGASIGQNKARDKIYNFISSGAKAGVSAELPLKLNASLMLDYLETRYSLADPFFGKKRQEKKQSIELAITPLALSVGGFAPRVVLGHVDNRCNIDLYRYQRTYGKVAFVRDF